MPKLFADLNEYKQAKLIEANRVKADLANRKVLRTKMTKIAELFGLRKFTIYINHKKCYFIFKGRTGHKYQVQIDPDAPEIEIFSILMKYEDKGIFNKRLPYFINCFVTYCKKYNIFKPYVTYSFFIPEVSKTSYEDFDKHFPLHHISFFNWTQDNTVGVRVFVYRSQPKQPHRFKTKIDY